MTGKKKLASDTAMASKANRKLNKLPPGPGGLFERAAASPAPPTKQAPMRKPSRRQMELVSAQSAPLGMYDQDGLYPNLITEVDGTRVAVPLGSFDDTSYKTYEVAPFTYQSIPQPEYEAGRCFPIKCVKLLSLDRDVDRFGPNLGDIQVRFDGSLAMYCMGYRGYTAWVPVPGCHTDKRPGNVYKKWEILVGSTGEAPRVIVRFDQDQDSFQHWPKDCKR